LEQESHLDAALKEQVRRTLAQKNGCQYCQAKGKPMMIQDEKTAVCTAYAEAFLQTKGYTSPNVTNVLNDVLTEDEKSELLAFICFITASQYFSALMQLQPK
jgi:alkylhydroperoxidase family enzyme